MPTVDKEVNPRFEKTYKVYKHVFPNGKVYVGITCRSVHIRWDSGKGYGDTLVGRAINKYGWENIKHYLLKGTFSAEEAKSHEKRLIQKYKSNDPEFGYNQTAGGDGSVGYRHNEEAKRKMSESHADVSGENNPFHNKKHSAKTRARLSEINSGKSVPEATREKISKALQGENHPLYGKSPSEETRKRMSESHKGQRLGVKFSEEHKNNLSSSIKKSWESRPRHFSEETRRKMSEAQLRRHRGGDSNAHR